MTESRVRIPFQEEYSRRRRYKLNKRSSLVPKQHKSSIYRLYLYYRYLLRTYPKKRIYKPISEELRKEIKKMEQISDEVRFLNSKDIHTVQELSLYKNTLQTEIENLTREKRTLYEKMKGGVEDKERLKENSLDLTFQIKALRKEVRMCESIETRLPKIKDNLKEMEEQKERGKEREKNEHIR